MDKTLVFKKLVKYEGSSSGYPVMIRYTPSTNTHVIIYEGGFKKNDFFLKRFTPVFIRIFGEPFISLLGKIPDYLINVLWVMLFFLISVSGLPDSYAIPFILILVSLMLVVSELIPLLSYAGESYRDSLCDKCGNEFSCEETKVPEI